MQTNYAEVDFGFLRNAAHTYRRQANAYEDDILTVEIEVQATDFETHQGSIFTIEIGMSSNQTITTIERQIQILRLGSTSSSLQTSYE